MAIEQAQKAVSILRKESSGVQWELTTAQVILYPCLFWVGEWRELVRLLEEAMRDATARGDLYAETVLRVMTPSIIGPLVADQPDIARDEIEKALRQWATMTGGGIDLPHIFGAGQICGILLYSGDARAALQELDRHWNQTRRFLSMLRSDLLTTLAWTARGHVAAAAAATCEPSNRGALVDEVRYAAKRIARQRTPSGQGFVAVLNAFLANTSGNVSRCLDLLADAQAAFDAADMKMAATSVEWTRGSIIGGESGRKLVESAEVFMRQQGIRRPDRIARAHVPGFVVERPCG
jgi:hypothetical protein